MTNAGSANAIEMRGVTKRYPRVIANQDASLSVRRGEIHAVVGENGAGKSTLMKVLAGVTRPDEGVVEVGGKAYQKYTPEEAAHRGVGMVFQHFVLVPTLTVAENVVLGHEPRKGVVFDRARAESDVLALSRRFGLEVDPSAPVETCSIGVQQRVEILKVLARGAEVLILDEPTAILTPAEVDELLAVLRRLAGEGKTIVLITHKLREVMAVAERITIMRAGRTVTTVEVKSTTQDAVAELMVGRPPKHEQRPPARPRGPAVLEVKGLVARSDRGPVAVHGIDLVVHAGEIVGIAGIEGNGQTELIECITGLRAPQAGTVRIAGTDVTSSDVATRLKLGMAHVPEDRHRRGVVLDFSIEENVILGAPPDRYARMGVLDRGRMRTETLALVKAHDVRPPDPDARMSALSGGNQQKVVIGRELGRSPRLIIAAHPTRGLDLGAMEHVDSSLVQARANDVAVLLVSAELSELLAIADRIVVLYGGRVAGEVDLRSATADERTLGAMMAGKTA